MEDWAFDTSNLIELVENEFSGAGNLSGDVTPRLETINDLT